MAWLELAGLACFSPPRLGLAWLGLLFAHTGYPQSLAIACLSCSQVLRRAQGGGSVRDFGFYGSVLRLSDGRFRMYHSQRKVRAAAQLRAHTPQAHTPQAHTPQAHTPQAHETR